MWRALASSLRDMIKQKWDLVEINEHNDNYYYCYYGFYRKQFLMFHQLQIVFLVSAIKLMYFRGLWFFIHFLSEHCLQIIKPQFMKRLIISYLKICVGFPADSIEPTFRVELCEQLGSNNIMSSFCYKPTLLVVCYVLYQAGVQAILTHLTEHS